MQNSLNFCEELNNMNETSGNAHRLIQNQDEIEREETSNNNARYINSSLRFRVHEIKFKVKVDEVKGNRAVRLFSVNYNGLVPQSSSKKEQIRKEIKKSK